MDNRRITSGDDGSVLIECSTSRRFGSRATTQVTNCKKPPFIPHPMPGLSYESSDIYS